MEWRESDGLKWLEAELPGARAAFTTRTGGSSEGAFASLNLGLLTDDDSRASPRQPRCDVRSAGRRAAPASSPASRCTAPRSFARRSPANARPGFMARTATRRLSTAGRPRLKGLAPLVFVADCLPVALAGAWRRRDDPLRLARARGRDRRTGVHEVSATAAAIGPGIGPCCFEVGPEVTRRVLGSGRRTSRTGGCSTCPRSASASCAVPA